MTVQGVTPAVQQVLYLVMAVCKKATVVGDVKPCYVSRVFYVSTFLNSKMLVDMQGLNLLFLHYETKLLIMV